MKTLEKSLPIENCRKILFPFFWNPAQFLPSINDVSFFPYFIILPRPDQSEEDIRGDDEEASPRVTRIWKKFFLSFH